MLQICCFSNVKISGNVGALSGIGNKASNPTSSGGTRNFEKQPSSSTSSVKPGIVEDPEDFYYTNYDSYDDFHSNSDEEVSN